MTEEIVFLCTRVGPEPYIAALRAAHPGLRLRPADEIEAPDGIRFALGFEPTPDQVAQFPNLELFVSLGAGADGVLSNPALDASVHVVRMVNPAQADMMAGYVAHYVVGWHRQLWDYAVLQAERRWDWLSEHLPPQTFPVGLLGYGHLGQRIGAAMRTLGYPVTAWARSPRTDAGDIRVETGAEGLTRVLAQSRAVVNVLPLTPETHGLLDGAALGRMRKDAILIQVGRGEHVVTSELIASLDQGRPGCAVLDVVEGEPLPPDSPLWGHPNIRITPHMASFNGPDFIVGALAKAIHAVRAGETPPGLLDRTRGY